MQKKSSMKKVVKSKVVAQKWLWWSDNGKIFNNNNSGKFVSIRTFFLVWLFLCRLLLAIIMGFTFYLDLT